MDCLLFFIMSTENCLRIRSFISFGLHYADFSQEYVIIDFEWRENGMKSKVFFKPCTIFDPPLLSKVARELFEKMIEEEHIELLEEVPLKVHFGEKGNTTFLSPACFDGVIDVLEEKGIKTRFMDSNVLYRGSRTTREEHLKTAREHGFTRIPITIADGHHGEETQIVSIEGEYFDSVILGKAYEPFDQFVVLAHFKGHNQAGFGGAMKQLAMGFASRAGKMAQHAAIRPWVKEDKCVACGTCLEYCDHSAITIDEVAYIDPELCVGCAACIAGCPTGAVAHDWSGENFIEKLAEYAYGAQKDKEMIYINYLLNITELCDCVGRPLDIIADNIGVFVSTDAVAIDKACLDTLQEREGSKLFEKGRAALVHAHKLGMGSLEYELIEI